MTTPRPSAPEGARLSRARVADQIIAQLQNKIADGSYPRGSRLPTERVLATAYGVSAPTIREALRALTSMGLVEVRHGSGAYVATSADGLIDSALAMLVELEEVSLLDLLGLLQVLNRYVADLAVEHATDEDIERVAASAEASAHCESSDEIAVAATAFLTSFAACAHQPLLDALCGFLVRVVVHIETVNQPKRSAPYWRRWAAETSVVRIDIARALKRRDARQLGIEVDRLHSRIRERVAKLPALRDSRMSGPRIGPLRLLSGSQS
jgi:GntR family transcriptional regulator, transcriptional repressor for pyruvate dehydrogenase complex